MTIKRLFELIDGGVGSGVAESHCPWIRVRRYLSSPVSTIFVSHSPLYRHRSLHLLSTGEERASRLAIWLGAIEVREQMPMWPDGHKHPLSGWDEDRDRSLSQIRGLLQIAHDLGIKHGFYPGTNIPFVATTDLMIRHGVPPNDQLALWQCKPASHRRSLRNQRSLERLALEAAYAVEVGATSRTIFSDTLSERFHENLFWLEPLRSEIDAFGQSVQLRDFAAEFMLSATDYSIDASRCKAAKACQASAERSHQFFRMAAWGELIDIDLSRPIYMNQELQRDHGDIYGSVRKELLGAA